MNRSKSPPVNLEKYLEGKRHRFCTYAQGARLYAMAYWSFVTMAKQEQLIDLRPYREDDSLTQEMMIDILIQKRATPQNHKKIRPYLLATLFNAPSTMSSYYQAEVNHDMACGLI